MERQVSTAVSDYLLLTMNPNILTPYAYSYTYCYTCTCTYADIRTDIYAYAREFIWKYVGTDRKLYTFTRICTQVLLALLLIDSTYFVHKYIYVCICTYSYADTYIKYGRIHTADNWGWPDEDHQLFLKARTCTNLNKDTETKPKP